MNNGTKKFQIKLEDGFPLPTGAIDSPNKSMSQILRDMRVGQSFLCPVETYKNSIKPLSYTAGVALVKEPVSKGVLRVWKINKSGGAKVGTTTKTPATLPRGITPGQK